MSILDKIRTFLSRKKIGYSEHPFIFPYSANKEIKQQQIWANLKHGILFEDIPVFIPWLTPFADLDQFATQREELSDRTNWHLGEHAIVDGYQCSIDVMKWLFIKRSTAFSQIEVFLGNDEHGNKEFTTLKSKITDLLGDPSNIQLNKFGDLDLGSIEWIKHDAKICLSGIDQHACRYRLYIGLSKT